MRWIVVLGLLPGCVLLPEEDFRERYPREFCGRAQACLWDVPADVEACREFYLEGLEAAQPACSIPIYDEAFAKDCVAEVRRLPCEASGYADPTQPPPSCRDVYGCSDPLTTGYF